MTGLGVIGLPYPPFGVPLEEWTAEIEAAVEMACVYQEETGDQILVLGHLDLESTAAARGSESKDFSRGRAVYWPTELLRTRLPRSVSVGGHLHRPQHTDGVFIVGSLARLRHDEESNDPGFLVVRAGRLVRPEKRLT